MDKFNYKKSLGQNFLQDEELSYRIVNSVEAKDKDLIIEIGPGSGMLTKYLSELKTNVLCFEIDTRLKEKLEKLENETTHVIYEDFLNADLEKYIDKDKYENIYFIANLPYYITTPIIKKIIKSNLNPKKLMLMVQKEVALRFSAKPGTKDYSAITVFFNYFYDVKIFEIVTKDKFFPVPKVDSAVLEFTKKENQYNVKNEEVFFKLVEDSFKQKRKTLKNNLKNYNNIGNIFEKLQIKDSTRAEELEIEDFIKISNEIS